MSQITPSAVRAGLVPPLLSISKSARTLTGISLAGTDVHIGQDSLLDQIEPGQPVTVSDLAMRLNVRPSTVSKMVDRLVEKDLLTRSRCQVDGRQCLIHLTPQGRSAKAAVLEVWQRLERSVAGDLDDVARADLALALQQTADLLQSHLRRHR